MTTLGSIIGTTAEDEFLEFDLTEVQELLGQLSREDAIDLAHAEILQQKALRCADILSDLLSKMVKTTSYIEGKLNSKKNKTSLEYEHPSGKTTAEMRKYAGECSQEVNDLHDKLSKAKGAKIYLEKKYDIIIKTHHHYKDIASGLRKSIVGFSNTLPDSEIAEGYR